MKRAYGYKRRKAELEALGAKAIYMDGEGTRRTERVDLFRDLNPGDTLVLIRISDLGAGKGLRNMRAELDARGVDIEIAAREADEPKPMGRPRAWNMTDAEDARFKAMWQDVSVDGGYILDQACDLLSLDKSDNKIRSKVRQRLIRRYGHRGQRQEGDRG